MIQEPDAGPYPDMLGSRYLGGMVSGVLRGDLGVGRGEILVGEDIRVGEVIKGTAINREGNLNFGFVGCAIDESCAAVGHFNKFCEGEKGRERQSRYNSWSLLRVGNF
jgi:hypothetical protein